MDSYSQEFYSTLELMILTVSVTISSIADAVDKPTIKDHYIQRPQHQAAPSRHSQVAPFQPEISLMIDRQNESNLNLLEENNSSKKKTMIL